MQGGGPLATLSFRRWPGGTRPGPFSPCRRALAGLWHPALGPGTLLAAGDVVGQGQPSTVFRRTPVTLYPGLPHWD